MSQQKTLKSSVKTSGIGVHSGVTANLTIKPASVDSGIVFVRSDLKESNIIPAVYDKVIDARLCTIIQNDAGARVSTIEHLMSAFYGLGIDNAIVEIDQEEMPIMDGSSATFIALIEKAGIIAQSKGKKYLRITKAIEIEEGDKKIIIEPSDQFSINCAINFSHPVIGQQEVSFSADCDYRYDVSRARTFGFAHEIEQLKKMGLARGGSLDNAVGLDETSVLNPEGLRYEDEFVRHKLLDMLGDLKLAGMEILGKVSAFKPSHQLNNTLLRKIFESVGSFEIVEDYKLVAQA
ncbi:MAG: UDP-3-O-acyl-N-acetylglucosamine deacetylase [Alphaproteobacteria bacterium]|jgi:UDP-3-O-[3-hydroxymyristoyl] N-acetylglucosamine deacetylase|nr:UDP-3-O-acyl-N-acetylglucosamine deacetylase [Candidatus Jidaibacter sp.]